MNMIPGLKVGEAVVVGEAVNYPILIRVRERKSKIVERGMSLEDELAVFNSSEKLREDDMKAFANFDK